jgi:hypothetical protein
LLGTLIPLVPIFLPYVALVLLFSNRVILGALALLGAALVSPTRLSQSTAIGFANEAWRSIIGEHLQWVLIPFAFVVAVLLLFELLGQGPSFFFKTIAAIACIALIPFVSLLYPFPANSKSYGEIIRTPWLPAETITLRSGPSFTGYILSENQDWVVILGNATRKIHYYRRGEIKDREVCQLEQASTMPPLISLIPTGTRRLSNTPSCETPSADPAPSGLPRSSARSEGARNIAPSAVPVDRPLARPILYRRAPRAGPR